MLYQLFAFGWMEQWFCTFFEGGIKNNFGDLAIFNSSVLLKCKLVSILKLQLATGGLLNLLCTKFEKKYPMNQPFCHSPDWKYFLGLSHLYFPYPLNKSANLYQFCNHREKFSLRIKTCCCLFLGKKLPTQNILRSFSILQ